MNRRFSAIPSSVTSYHFGQQCNSPSAVVCMPTRPTKDLTGACVPGRPFLISNGPMSSESSPANLKETG